MFGGGRRNKDNTQNNLQRQAATVEKILVELGVDVARSRMALEGSSFGWSFMRGSALIEVYLAQHGGREYFQVLAPLIHLPAVGLLALYRRLLEMNMSLTNAALGVHQDVVFIYSERPLAGLDASEANFVISNITQYADELDNVLVNEFGGRLYSQA